MSRERRRLMEIDPERPGFLGTLRGEEGDRRMIEARVMTAIIVALIIVALLERLG